MLYDSGARDACGSALLHIRRVEAHGMCEEGGEEGQTCGREQAPTFSYYACDQTGVTLHHSETHAWGRAGFGDLL